MEFDKLINKYVLEQRKNNTWELNLPQDAKLMEIELCCIEHLKDINPFGVITFTIGDE